SVLIVLSDGDLIRKEFLVDQEPEGVNEAAGGFASQGDLRLGPGVEDVEHVGQLEEADVFLDDELLEIQRESIPHAPPSGAGQDGTPDGDAAAIICLRPQPFL